MSILKVRTDVKSSVSRWARALCATLVMALGFQGNYVQAQTVYFHNDAAGSAIAATDEVGNLLWKESYRPYGERLLKPSTANVQWFHGKQVDPDTDLSDFGARNYDPILGRFLSTDPIGFSPDNLHSFNRYAYGNNNPLRYKDPNGESAASVVLSFFAIVGIVYVLGGFQAARPIQSGAPPLTPAQRDYGISTPPSAVTPALGRDEGYRPIEVKPSDIVMSKVDGNSNASENPHHGYIIVDTWTDEVVKVGISGQSLNKNGDSPRANEQAYRWNREPGNKGRFRGLVQRLFPAAENNRATAKRWEEEKAKELRAEGHLTDPNRHQTP